LVLGDNPDGENCTVEVETGPTVPSATTVDPLRTWKWYESAISV
jgi:hypothetical protein